MNEDLRADNSEMQPQEPEKSVADDSSISQAEEGKSIPAAATPVNPWHPDLFPDGGVKAWLVVAGAFCCLFVSFGWINCKIASNMEQR
jgi:hypothetical protein